MDLFTRQNFLEITERFKTDEIYKAKIICS